MARGGKRPGAGKPPLPESERLAFLGVKVPPELLEYLDGWQAMGYPSQSAAVRGALALWASLRDAGFWAIAAECEDLATQPRRRVREVSEK